MTPRADPETLSVRVRPRSSRAGITYEEGRGIVIRVHAPAAEGAANEECRTVLAKALNVPRSAIQIARGVKSRTKQIAVAGMAVTEARARLQEAASPETRRS